MKKLTFKNIILMLISWMLVAAPFAAFAADTWNETPDLNHNSKFDSAATGTARFYDHTPDVNIYTETPDILLKNQNHRDVVKELLPHVDHVDENMYTETPDTDG